MAKTKKRFVIHDEAVNSYGISVLTAGVNLDRFIKNPVMLYAHDNKQEVIGRWEDIQVVGKQILATPVFDLDDEVGAKVAQRVEKGFLKATSLGLVFDERDLKVDGENVQLSKCEVVECSIVSIPSNPNTLLIEDSSNTKKSELKLFYKSGNSIALSGKVSKRTRKFLASKDDEPVTLQERIIKLLELDEEATDEDIFEAVEMIFEELSNTREEQEQEAEGLVNLAIDQNKLPKNLKAMQLRAFKEDFYSAKKSLLAMFPFKNTSLLSLVVTGGTNNKNTNSLNGATDKPKSEWTLSDYRKHAPKELQADPALYKKLIEKQTNK